MEKLFYIIPKDGVDQAIAELEKQRGSQIHKINSIHLEEKISMLKHIAKNPAVPVRFEEPSFEIGSRCPKCKTETLSFSKANEDRKEDHVFCVSCNMSFKLKSTELPISDDDYRNQITTPENKIQ
jgi:hypothetical protein